MNLSVKELQKPKLHKSSTMNRFSFSQVDKQNDLNDAKEKGNSKKLSRKSSRDSQSKDQMFAWPNSEGPIKNALRSSQSDDAIRRQNQSMSNESKKEREFREDQERRNRVEYDNQLLLEEQMREMIDEVQQNLGEYSINTNQEQDIARGGEGDQHQQEEEEEQKNESKKENEQINESEEIMTYQQQRMYADNQIEDQSKYSSKQHQEYKDEINDWENNQQIRSLYAKKKSDGLNHQFETFSAKKGYQSRDELITSVQRKYIADYQDLNYPFDLASQNSVESQQTSDKKRKRNFDQNQSISKLKSSSVDSVFESQIQQTSQSGEKYRYSRRKLDDSDIEQLSKREGILNIERISPPRGMGRSILGCEVEILASEKLLLQQQVILTKQDNERQRDHYEQMTASLKEELKKMKELVKMQERALEEQNYCLREEGIRQEKNEHLQSLIQKIQVIDNHTEQIFEERIQRERAEKEEIIEKNLILKQEIKDLESNLNYCRQYLLALEESKAQQEKSYILRQQKTIEAGDNAILEERRNYKQSLEIVNSEIKRLIVEKEELEKMHQREFRDQEGIFRKQLDDMKKAHELSYSKIRSLTEDFENLYTEASKNKELLMNTQRQLKNCEIKNSELNEELAKERMRIEGLKEKDGELKQLNIQQKDFLNEIKNFKQQIENYQKMEIDYKQLEFAFEVEGKRMKELEGELKMRMESNDNLLKEIDRLRAEKDKYKKLFEESKEQKRTEIYELKEKTRLEIVQLQEINYKQAQELREEIEKNKNAFKLVEERLNEERLIEKQQMENQIKEGYKAEMDKEQIENISIQLKVEIERLQSKCVQLEQNANKLNLKIHQLQEDNHNKDVTIQKLTRKDDKHSRRQQEQLALLQAQIESQSINEKNLLEENVKLKSKVKKIESESFLQLEEFKSQLDSYYNNLLIKQQGEDTIENYKEIYQSEVLSLKKRICDLESDYSLLSLENERFLRDITVKNDEIESLYNRLKEKELSKSLQFSTETYRYETSYRTEEISHI